MKVLLFGAGGHIGQAIAAELLGRGHTVTGVTRSGKSDLAAQGLSTVAGDATDPAEVAALAPGHDAIVTAVGPSHSGSDDPKLVVRAAEGLVDGARRSGIRRLVVVGGAGSLEAAPGVLVLDTPDFPEAWKPVAAAHRDALEFYRGVDDLDWTFISPAAIIGPGDRTGSFRVGGDQLLVDSDGNSRISYDDYAIGLVDELERGIAIRRRITLGY
jgi:putative NADH-flavin reductase